MYADHLLQPWLQRFLAHVPEAQVFDAHTHVGENDPSGFTASVEELLGSLELADGRAAVFPLAEPDGYRVANLACAEAAAKSDGRLVAFVRLTPDEEPARLLDEGLAAGARGVKLHLSSDEFELDDPRLHEVYAVADAAKLPVIVHAGPEVESVGDTAVAICERWPGLRMVLAHCAIPDLGLLWPRVPHVPNLFFDTGWWTPANTLALFRLVPPGRILCASDLPYSTPVSMALSVARLAWQSGLDPTQIASVLGGQFSRLVNGEEPLDLGGPPPGERLATGPFLEIVSTNLLTALEAMQRGEEPGVPLTVARHACRVSDDDPDASVLAEVLRLLDLYEEHHERLPQRNQFRPGFDLISLAVIVARTPAAPLA
jgi:uncharacterized protein